MEKDSTTQKAMEKEMASITQERDDLRNKLENERVSMDRAMSTEAYSVLRHELVTAVACLEFVYVNP